MKYFLILFLVATSWCQVVKPLKKPIPPNRRLADRILWSTTGAYIASSASVFTQQSLLQAGDPYYIDSNMCVSMPRKSKSFGSWALPSQSCLVIPFPPKEWATSRVPERVFCPVRIEDDVVVFCK